MKIYYIKRAFLAFFFLAFQAKHAIAQQSGGDFQIGAGIKVRCEIGFWKARKLSNFQVGLTGGIAKSLKLSTNNDGATPVSTYFFPSCHASLFLCRGGLGSSVLPNDNSQYHLEFVTAAALTWGYKTAVVTDNYYFRPFSTFRGQDPFAFIYPFQSGVTVGSNYIFTSRKDTFGRHNQMVGYLNATFKGLQIGYFNDGPPFDFLGLGDGRDRYWTGGGFVNMAFDKTRFAQLSFEKFTGYTRETYEVSNLLHLRYVPYGNQSRWNQSRWSLYYSTVQGMSAVVSLYNTRNRDIEVQHRLHRAFFFPYHDGLIRDKLLIGFQGFGQRRGDFSIQ